jgi:hypothetical protein
MKKLTNPITGKSFSVALNDFPNEMTYNEAASSCKDLGRGWRLPSKEELSIIFANRESIGNFKNVKYQPDSSGSYYNQDHSWYISSSNVDKSAWMMDFYSGKVAESDWRDATDTKYWVRAVINSFFII